MRIPENYDRFTIRDLQLQQPGKVPAGSRNFSSGELADERERITEPEQKTAASVLNAQELATLHMLFGAEKPQELSFYGKAKIQQIHKGQLINVMG